MNASEWQENKTTVVKKCLYIRLQLSFHVCICVCVVFAYASQFDIVYNLSSGKSHAVTYVSNFIVTIRLLLTAKGLSSLWEVTSN